MAEAKEAPAELHGSSEFLSAKATYFWKVDRFSALDSDVGDETQSPEFTLLDNKWRIDLYPNGDEDENKGYIGVFLTNLGTRPVKLEYGFAAVNSKGALLEGCDSDMGKHEFSVPELDGWSHGSAQWCARADILDPENNYLENDTLRIKLTLKVDRLKLGSCLADLLDEPVFSDVSLIVSGTEIPAHRNILSARSDYFKSMFAHKMKESSEGVVRIDDIPVSVFRQLLQFMYTDESDYDAAVQDEGDEEDAKEGDDQSNGSSSDGKSEKKSRPNKKKRKRAAPVLDMTLQLLAAADRFQVDDLKESCIERLCEGLTAKNAAERLLLADRHSAPDLKKKVLEFIHADKTRLAEVMDSEAYQEFKASLIHDLLAASLPVGESARKKEETLIKADVAGLSFSELRAELASRGLETGGRKAELVERLENALDV